MKIVIDARSRGSTGRYAEKLIEHLQTLDTENEYVVIAKDGQDIGLSNPNFSLVRNNAKDYTFAEQLSLWWTIRRLKPDVTHFTMPQQPVLPLPGQRITTIHDLTMLRFHNINGNKAVYYTKLVVFRLLLLWVTWRSAAIITPTKWVKLDVIKTLKADPMKTHITYEAAEPIAARAEPIDGLKDQTYLLFNGNVQPHKNVRRLIEAHQQLLRQHNNLKLIIAGKIGEQGEILQAEVAERGYAQVQFLGFVPDPQMKWLWTNATVYIYPGLSEGFGLPGLESMLVKTPVASSNATCLPEVYQDAAEYFDPYDVDDMVRAIDLLLNDESRRKELVKAGTKLVNSYSWRRMSEQTLAIYNQPVTTQG
jgi:glycosyltransferase involved in cell wall biosynthesis